MSATETASPSPAGSSDGGGVTSKPAPTSTWTPNADAAEWTPNFAVSAAPVAAKGGVAAGRAEVLSTSAVEAGAHAGSSRGTKVADGPEATGDASVKADAKPAANGGGASANNASSEHKADVVAAGAASGGGKPRTVTRYEVDFLLKMRPNPESTPKPAGLQPPDRVDILWDGKEPTPAKTGVGSIRGGIRPLPPLGGRMGSSRPGLGEARAAPPPLRGAQREIGRDRDTRIDPRIGVGSGSGRDDRRSSGGGSSSSSGAGRGKGGGGGGRRAHIDTAPPLDDCKPIEINEATRWKPKSLETKKSSKEVEKELPVEEVLRKAIAILNKMTLEKFGKLSVAFMEVGCRDPEVVSGVIDMIVEKAQMEHHFSSMYADLCERIARTPIAGLGEDATGKDAAKGSKKFRKMLLLKCQEEFEKDWQGLFAAVQNDPKLADDVKTEKEFVLKRKYMGHMRFVGELYKVELLKERHVLEAIHDMFGGNVGEPDEERLECMVKLLQTCGSKLDSTGSPDTAKDMKRLFKRIGRLADTRHISSRVRFMLRDLIELRNNRWVPRRAEEKAKTMQELHNDIAKEEESKNRASGRGGGSSSRSGGGTGSSGSSSLRPGSGDARLSGSSRSDSSNRSTGQSQTASKATPKDDDGWEVVPKKGGGKTAAAGDGWSQVPSSRSRTGNPGSDERRGTGGAGGAGSLVTQQSAFALLGSQDDDTSRDKKKKKKDSKKDKSSKKKDRPSSSSKSSIDTSTNTKSSSKTGADGKAPSGVQVSSPVTVKPPLPPPHGEESAMTEETARTKGKDIVAEYAMSGELEEACTCLSEIDEAVRWAAVSGAVNDAMERKQKHRDALAIVLAAGAKDGLLPEDSLMRGINDVLEIVPDVCIDVPQATTYVATAVASLVLGGHLSFGGLVASPCEGLLEGGKAAEFAVVVLSELKAAAKAEGMSEEDAAARVSELSRGNLDLAKLASMLPAICRGDEGKAMALLERKGVSIV